MTRDERVLLLMIADKVCFIARGRLQGDILRLIDKVKTHKPFWRLWR